ncbi:MAG: uroporphyrinogen-III synthase [Bacteroidales bacterium]
MIKSVKNILISQNAPAEKEQSQYNVLAKKFNLNLTFNKFFEVVRISKQEYRAQRINLLDFPAVIMTSKIAVDNYFYFANESRIKIPDDMKFFCTAESIANYLQTYIQYRKRKIFYSKNSFDDLINIIHKHKEEKYLFPCAEDGSTNNFKKLEAEKINYTKIIMHRSESKDLSNIDISKYDMVVMFAPIGVKSFIRNFPNVTSDDIIFAAMGKTTQTALQKAKLKATIIVPTPKNPSMIMALNNFFEERPGIKSTKKEGIGKGSVKKEGTNTKTMPNSREEKDTTANKTTKTKKDTKNTKTTKIKRESVVKK